MLGSMSQWSHTGLTSHPEWHYWVIQWWRSLSSWLLLIQVVKSHQIPKQRCWKCAVTHTLSLCPVLRDMHWWSMRHTKRPRQPWKGSTVRTWWASLSVLTGDLSEGPPRTRGGEGLCVLISVCLDVMAVQVTKLLCHVCAIIWWSCLYYTK